MELNGDYIVYFKHPEMSDDNLKIEKFRGKCENFHPMGKCVFKNEDNEILVVRYKDIVQMKPTN